MPDRDDEGKFSGDASKEDVYDVMEPLEPYTTGELANEIGIPRRTAYHYLEQLADGGRIRKKKPDPRSAIWIRTENHS